MKNEYNKFRIQTKPCRGGKGMKKSDILCISFLIITFFLLFLSNVLAQRPSDLSFIVKKEPDPAPLILQPSPAARKLIRIPSNHTPFPNFFYETPGVITVTDEYLFENVAQVIGPKFNSECLGGQIVLLTWSSDRPQKYFLHRNLYDPSGWFYEKAETNSAKKIVTRTEHEIRGDPILIKLKDGSILAFRLLRTWEPVNQTPPWWNQFKMEHCNFNYGCRGATGVWKSTDCGKTWDLIAVIDPINFENGDYAWPRPNRDENGNITAIDRGWHASFDRIEAYADPWSGHIYFSGYIAAGPKINYQTGEEYAPKKETHFFLRSKNGGVTWELIKKFDGVSTPLVMTSTPNGRLYVYTVIGTTPTLYYTLLNKPGVVFSSPKIIFYKVGQEILPAGIDSIYHNMNSKYTNSISRVTVKGTSSKVRLSYQFVDAINNQKTAIAIVKVDIPDDNSEPIVTAIRTFRAINPYSSILSATFVDPDPESINLVRAETSFFYWVEGSTNPNTYAYARYSLFSGDKNSSEPVVLGEPWRPTKSVAHYMYGGAYSMADGSLNFLGQWVQDDGIRANIVSIPAYGQGERLSKGSYIMQNVELSGGDFRHILFDPPSAGVLDVRQQMCSQECRQNKKCVAWTYKKPTTYQAKGHCFLKNRISEKVNNTSCVSGTVGEPNIDRPGGDYLCFDNVFGESVTAQFCKARCISEKRCKAWTFVMPYTIRGQRGLCCLKEIIPTSVENKSCISGYIETTIIR
jgi:hypothetical protein